MSPIKLTPPTWASEEVKTNTTNYLQIQFGSGEYENLKFKMFLKSILDQFVLIFHGCTRWRNQMFLLALA